MEINSFKIQNIIIVLFMTRSRRYNMDCNGKNRGKSSFRSRWWSDKHISSLSIYRGNL